MHIPAEAVRTQYQSPLGLIHLLVLKHHLVGVWFDGQAHQPDLSRTPVTEGSPIANDTARQLTEYFAGHRQSFELPTKLIFGTPFQHQVWRLLSRLAFGDCCSYRDIALQLGKPLAARAVGAAVGRNPLSLIIPCHRVLSAKGKLTGYAGGLERKAALLLLEGVV